MSEVEYKKGEEILLRWMGDDYYDTPRSNKALYVGTYDRDGDSGPQKIVAFEFTGMGYYRAEGDVRKVPEKEFEVGKKYKTELGNIFEVVAIRGDRAVYEIGTPPAYASIPLSTRNKYKEVK